MNWPGWREHLVTPSEQQSVTACTWAPVPSAPSAQQRPPATGSTPAARLQTPIISLRADNYHRKIFKGPFHYHP